MRPADVRRTLVHLRDVDRVAIVLGAAGVVSLLLIAAAWAFGWL
ncbi:MAG: hypothetical protein ABSH46_01925 [Bryobacteraceae bacterium]|jgi:hypothetical protein